MSGLKFTRKESVELVELVAELQNLGLKSKSLQILEEKLEKFEKDRTKTCLCCGAKFLSTRKSKIYCSRKCINKANYIKRTSAKGQLEITFNLSKTGKQDMANS